MGVPKFYRWISERYPCLSEVLKEYQIPEFDNLYLDMNGIIHVCSHPDDGNPHFRITEEKIFADIFHYIEVLFRLIKPKKVFFMAIDGVAPRAKMNQQRGRRFRSAREAEDLIRQALEKGEILPSEARFDSNCITPGTEFMVKLHTQLQFFVASKVSTDRSWQGIRVYLSGHETPGEGEHKVMDFIRAEKARPDFDPNTRHCLYGLDADLIMLGLASHEPHFSLLREEVRFGGKQQKRSNAPEETTFHLLHLSLMREYLDFEFQDLKEKLPFKYDLERLIDDWILMGFLVGNDFIPHLPHMHIHHECLPLLWKTYKSVLPKLDGYLHDAGKLNLARFEEFLQVLSLNDFEKFNEMYSDLLWLQSKKGQSSGFGSERPTNKEVRAKRTKKASLSSKETGIPCANDLVSLKDEESEDGLSDAFFSMSMDQDDGEEAVGNLGKELEKDEYFMSEFSKFKEKYYTEKLEYPCVTCEVLNEQAEAYVRAIQWILLYYFQGVPSWSWYYPYHYAPYLSDVRNFKHLELKYDLGRPFLPFQQLMAVLPSASKNLLPEPYQRLMTSDNSPTKKYYPEKFETDLNGKQQDWEAVVLIPFIEEELLVKAMESVAHQLTAEEKARNKHGPHLLFTSTQEPQPPLKSSLPKHLPDLNMNFAKCTQVPMDAFVLKAGQLKHGLCPGVQQDVYFPGFPTLKHIEHTAKTLKCGVKVFQMNSRGDNMILHIKEKPAPNLEQIAKEYVGRSVYVNWPHMMEALVLEVSNDEFKYFLANPRHKFTLGQKPEISYSAMDNGEISTWHKEMDAIMDAYFSRRGVEVGHTHILIHACPLIGTKYKCSRNGAIYLEKQWAPRPVPYVHQATVKDITVNAPKFKQYQTLDELFPVDSDVFMLGMPFYGAMGKVLSVDSQKDHHIRVNFQVPQEIDLNSAYRKHQQTSSKYMMGHEAARRLSITPLLLSRITGVVYVTRASKHGGSSNNRVNVGLNLKFNKTNKEVPGYTRKNNTEWTYSSRLVDLLKEYIQKFQSMFVFFASKTNEDSYLEEEIFPPGGPSLQDVSAYLKQLPCREVEPMQQGSQLLDDDVVSEIEKAVDAAKATNVKKRYKKMQVRPHLVYKSLEAQINLMPDESSKYELFDRVVNVREGYSVPLGLHGTVIGLILAAKEQDTLYEIVFDEPFVGGLTLRSSPNRAYRVPPTALINISHGYRKEHNKDGLHKPTAVVKPQSQAFGGSYGGQGPQSSRHPNHANKQQRSEQKVIMQRSRDKSGQMHGQKRKGPAEQPSQSARERLPAPHADEFANIWAQLQGGPQRGGAPDKGGGARSYSAPQGPSLAHAAKSLPKGPDASSFEPPPKTVPNKNRQGGTGRTRPPKHDSAPKGQKIDLQQMFEAAKNAHEKDEGQKMAPPSTDGIRVPAGSDAEQLEKMIQALQIKPEPSADASNSNTQAASQNAESTAALCQLLHIGESAPEEKKAKYGHHVSVEEIFQGAKPKGTAQPPQNTTKSAPVAELLAWCHSQNLPLPRYEHHSGNGKCQATVTLGNGFSIKGSWLPSLEEASESAASVAMSQLVQQPAFPPHVMTSVHQQLPSGALNLSASPNSAFTSVRPPMDGARFMPPHFPPSYNFAAQPFAPNYMFHGNPMQYQYGAPRQNYHHSQHQARHRHHYPQQHHYHPSQHYQHYRPPPPQQQQPQQQQQQQQQWPSVKPREQAPGSYQPAAPVEDKRSVAQPQPDTSPDQRNQGNNPFIPTQVLRKQKTPRKDSTSAEAAKEVAATNPGAEQKPPQGEKAATPEAPKAPAAKEAPVPASKAPPPAAKKAPAKKQNGAASQPRRPKSRIAANFGQN